MTRKTALQIMFAAIGSRLVAQETPAGPQSGSLPSPTVTGVFGTKPSLTIEQPKHLTFQFSAESLTIRVDGREVKFTAKELADALGAK